MATNYEKAIREVYKYCLREKGIGTVASYIPPLATIDPNQFGMCLLTNKGEMFAEGDSDIPFTIQSISKVFSLAMVLPNVTKLRQRVNVEPSGDPFNSLVQLEYERGIPRNPFINAGALVITDLLMAQSSEPIEAFRSFVSGLVGEELHYNTEVATQELATASRNRALAHLMQSFGNITHDVEELLYVYCHQCALSATLRQLTHAFSIFARHGKTPLQKHSVLTRLQTTRINALMMTCGFYDESGEFAYLVGLPGKSGVGGGIATVLPDKFTLTTWSPGLNDKGNSMLGLKALERFTTLTGMSAI